MRKVLSTFASAALFCSVFTSQFFTPQASALTIENFQGSGSVLCTANLVMQQSKVTSSGSVGGYTNMACLKLSSLDPTYALTAAINTIRYSHSQDASVTGTSYLQWGINKYSSVPADIVPSLPSVDLTQDGGTGIVLKNTTYDCASTQNVKLVITVYDSRDIDGSKQSYLEYQLPCWSTFNAANPQHVRDASYGYSGSYTVPGVTFNFPFNDPNWVHVDGGTDFMHTGAVTIEITSLSPETDLTFRSIGTNGSCPNVPDPLTGIACTPTPTPTPTPTNTPTVTPTSTPTLTPTVTPTATPTGTPTVTPTVTITPTPSPTITPPAITECTRVAPNADMLKIGKTLTTSTSSITKIIKDDIARAGKARQCRTKINSKKLLSYIRSTERKIKNEINSEILQSVEVCGTDCVKVSFLTEVATVKKMIKSYGNYANANAKKVAACAKSVRRPNTKGSVSTLSKVNSALNKPVNVTCNICP